MPSSTNQPRDAGLRIRVAPEELTLVDWPLRQRPMGSLVALALIGGGSYVAGVAAGHWAAGAALAAALALTAWRTWLPVTYEIGGGGITQVVFGRLRRRIPWTAIRQYSIQPDGVLLVPDLAVTPLSALRGLYLHWGEHREAVLAHLDYYLANWRAAPRISAHGSS